VRYNAKTIAWNIDEQGCWNCTSHRLADGYPMKRFRGRNWRISRIVWTQRFGEIPPGVCVCHKCDNPLCIRPDHLWIGTRADNAADMVVKGRASRRPGELSPGHKLTQSDANKIRLDARSTREIAAEYRVHHTTIARVKTNHNWIDSVQQRKPKSCAGSFGVGIIGAAFGRCANVSQNKPPTIL